MTDTLPDFIMNGAPTTDWQYVRETANHYTNAPVSTCLPYDYVHELYNDAHIS